MKKTMDMAADMAAISIEVTFGDHQWGESFEGLFFRSAKYGINLGTATYGYRDGKRMLG
jgi:hypothetical protein